MGWPGAAGGGIDVGGRIVADPSLEVAKGMKDSEDSFTAASAEVFSHAGTSMLVGECALIRGRTGDPTAVTWKPQLDSGVRGYANVEFLRFGGR